MESPLPMTPGLDPSPTSARADLQALMRIRNLELRARAVVEGFWHGLHRSPYHGFSVEFTEYRPYTPGDDARYLDWKLLARSDRYFIKKFEDETNLRCHLLVDTSRSMDYGSLGFTKTTYAQTLAATLAHFLHQQGDAVGLLTFGEQIVDYVPARHRVGHLRQLLLTLDKPAAGSDTNLSRPLRRMAEMVRKRGLLVLISDLLAPIAALDRDLATLTACGQDVVVFQIVDPAERTLDLGRAAVFTDLESGRQIDVDPQTARSDYVQRFETHAATIRQVCRGLGIGHHLWATDEPLDRALDAFLRQRMLAARRMKRFRRPANR